MTKTEEEPTRSANWHRRRLEIIDTSAEVFARNGYHATGTVELGEANQLAKGPLYYYIGSKEQLLAAINDRVLDEVMLGADRVAAAGGTPPEQLAMLGKEYFDTLMRFPDHFWVLLHEYPALTGEYAERFRRRRREYEKRLEAVFEAGIKSGHFREVDVHNATQAWMSARTRMVIQAEGSRSAKHFANTFDDIFVRGITRED